MQKAIDINCDLGESIHAEGIERDQAIMQFISSCNISCGLHAGNEESIAKAIENALQNGVKIGAHPSFDDRANFGRKEINLSQEALVELINNQLLYFKKMCEPLGATIHHIKAHGALYNQLAVSPTMSNTFCQTIADFNNQLLIYGLPNSALEKSCKANGLAFWPEAFADRRYEANGQLRSRQYQDAVIHQEQQLIDQLMDIVLNQKVKAVNGEWIPLFAKTICIHSDTVGSLHLAQKIWENLTHCHVRIGMD